MIDNQILVEEIGGNFGEKVYQFEEPYGFLTFTTTPENIVDVVSFLKNHPKLKFNFLTDITGIHFPDNIGGELCSVYHMHSWENSIRLRIKVFLPIENPVIPTMVNLYSCADWMERETYDFFGIIYSGHPNLKRILNIDEMDYFPLRKEYPLEDGTREDKIDELFGR